MRRLLAAATFAAALLSGAACGDSSTAPATVEGTYTLRTVNNGSLPQILDQDPTTGDKVEVTAGNVTLNSDGSFLDHTEFRVTEGGTARTEVEDAVGVWNRSGNTIFFTTNDGFQYDMVLGSGTLTQEIFLSGGAQLTFVYRK